MTKSEKPWPECLEDVPSVQLVKGAWAKNFDVDCEAHFYVCEELERRGEADEAFRFVTWGGNG